ncbi:MAG: putative oxidoreductase [Betaproteobacteria bacterium]|nr:putative oxidoreductase [Betaproteobacteria bacterium]
MSALRETTMRYAPLVGRILMALIFLTSAYGKITGFDATAVAMAGKGMPVPQVLLVCAITIELIGSTLLVAGWYTRSAALALIVFLIPATLYFHNYWAHPPEQARNQRNHFMKNVTILGALIFVTGMGAGPLSVDNRARRP